jgi:predicted membrane protein
MSEEERKKQEDKALADFLGSIVVGFFVAIFAGGLTMIIVPFFMGIFHSILTVIGVFLSFWVGSAIFFFLCTIPEEKKDA